MNAHILVRVAISWLSVIAFPQYRAVDKSTACEVLVKLCDVSVIRFIIGK